MTSDQLLTMDDMQLQNFLQYLGIVPSPNWTRDKMIEVVLKIAHSGRDS